MSSLSSVFVALLCIVLVGANRCDTAYQIASLPYLFTGQISPNSQPATSLCSSTSLKATWFHWIGTGGNTLLTLTTTAFRPSIQIVSTSCYSGQCLGTYLADENVGQLSVSLTSVSGVSYYIAVTSDTGTSSGRFEFRADPEVDVSKCGNGVLDDTEWCDSGVGCSSTCLCETGFIPTDPLSVNCTYAGCFPTDMPYVVESLPFRAEGDISTSPVSSSSCLTNTHVGDWYEYTRPLSLPSATVYVTTCNTETNFDTFLEVQSGSCESGFQCIITNDDGGCGGPAALQFYAVSGTAYYIFVHGHQNEVGQYSLYIYTLTDSSTSTTTPSETSASSDSICNEIPAISVNYNAYHTLKIDDSISDGCWAESIGKWFALVDAYGNITISTCSSETSLDTIVYVVEDLCSSTLDASCEEYNDDYLEDNCYEGNSKLSFYAYSGTTYYILVTGSQEDTGTFYLSVEPTYTNSTGLSGGIVALIVIASILFVSILAGSLVVGFLFLRKHLPIDVKEKYFGMEQIFSPSTHPDVHDEPEDHFSASVVRPTEEPVVAIIAPPVTSQPWPPSGTTNNLLL
ncbi:hypothetical protein Pelo_12949 [Pelomyxa schiedti]|nr:hypothetical protein Pelo_12949 [Pelomyxa schiedti]